jgi:lysophospholipid acyltransferase (LPLAT)-like uncharacterized protein
MKTWDGFMLPKPFSSIQITFGAPLVLSQESSLKQDVDSLTQHLMAIVQTTSSQI